MTWHGRRVLANSWVKEFGFRVSYFDVEDPYDYVQYGQHDASLQNSIGGNWWIAPNWHDFVVSTNLQAKPGTLQFYSDGWVSRQGVDFERARVCCNTTAGSGYHTLAPFHEYIGVLLGTGDVVYALVPGSSTLNITLTMRGQNFPGKDFDLYARCNAPPTEGLFDYFQWSGQQEYISIPAGQCVGGTWYVAVHSWSGAGYFTLVHSVHYPSRTRTISAGTGPHLE